MKEPLAAACALQAALGQTPTPSTGWSTALDLVAPRRRSHPQGRGSTPLAVEGPAFCVELEPSELAARLEQDHRPGKHAVPLRKLAEWWLSHFDRNPARQAEGRILNEPAVSQLRRIPGISREMSDRILLFALGVPVAPIGRAALRVGCRHAWCELEDEAEEWQGWVKRWANLAGMDLWQLVLWIDQVGSQWCGPQPRCEGCPLAPFLPPGGPRDPAE